jgi:hypothetical protein
MGDIGDQPVLKPNTIYTFDEVICERASDEDQSPLIAYPKFKLGITDYEHFTGKQLNRLVDGAAKALLKSGVRPLVSAPSFTFTSNFILQMRRGSKLKSGHDRMEAKMKSSVFTGYRILATSSLSSAWED